MCVCVCVWLSRVRLFAPGPSIPGVLTVETYRWDAEPTSEGGGSGLRARAGGAQAGASGTAGEAPSPRKMSSIHPVLRAPRICRDLPARPLLPINAAH